MYSCHLFLISPGTLKILTVSALYCAHPHMKYSLDISFLEKISSLSNSVAFLCFFALFFVCLFVWRRLSSLSLLSLELCIQFSLPSGFSRQEYWSGLPCLPLGNLLDPGIEPVSLRSPALAGGFFSTSTTWEAQLHLPGWFPWSACCPHRGIWNLSSDPPRSS